MEMTAAITKLETPIDVMYLIHKALRANAARVEQMIDQLEEGGGLQPFKRAFYHWVMALGYHADVEDKSMTAPLPDSQPARDSETAHKQLGEMLEGVQTALNDALGQAVLTSRTRRHLYGKVVVLRIAQDDHFEEEEAFVLPIIRQWIGEEQQLEMATRLLIPQDGEDKRWILEVVAGELTPTERQLLEGLTARLKEVSPASP
jgi:hemerythrin-like domain-containing protein